MNPYLVALSGGKSFAGVGGTSAASPTVAAMIAQVNNNRLKAGKKPMGWLNPFLYKTGEAAFHDVTTGKTSGGFTGMGTVYIIFYSRFKSPFRSFTPGCKFVNFAA